MMAMIWEVMIVMAAIDIVESRVMEEIIATCNPIKGTQAFLYQI